MSSVKSTGKSVAVMPYNFNGALHFYMEDHKQDTKNKSLKLSYQSPFGNDEWAPYILGSW